VAERVVEREAAKAALSALNDKDVEVIVLATWYGLSPREGARVVGCSATAFTVRLHRARERLTKAVHVPPQPGGRSRIALAKQEIR
jgi:RNA polymerase sigma-70 factor (ECF subfamily)